MRISTHYTTSVPYVSSMDWLLEYCISKQINFVYEVKNPPVYKSALDVSTDFIAVKEYKFQTKTACLYLRYDG